MHEEARQRSAELRDYFLTTFRRPPAPPTTDASELVRTARQRLREAHEDLCVARKRQATDDHMSYLEDLREWGAINRDAFREAANEAALQRQQRNIEYGEYMKSTWLYKLQQ